MKTALMALLCMVAIASCKKGEFDDCWICTHYKELEYTGVHDSTITTSCGSSEDEIRQYEKDTYAKDRVYNYDSMRYEWEYSNTKCVRKIIK